MILIKPSVMVMDDIKGDEILKKIELAGRVCYKSESRITNDSAEKFVRMLIKRGHESVLEHASITVKVVCDRGVSHELVRHRIASYSQESTRYCDYADGHITFIIPPWVNVEAGIYNSYIESWNKTYTWQNAMKRAEDDYKWLRRNGWSPEKARSVLPNSLKTEIAITMNLRAWRHFFKLRTAATAHPQMREVATLILEKFRELIPVIFDEI